MLLQDGDIIIADTAEDETVGKATEIINTSRRKIVSGLHTIACRPKIKMMSTYLGFYLNSEAYHKQLYSLMQGIKVLSISKSNIETTIIKYPCIAEQEKVCSLLCLIEKRINKQKQLVEHLKKYKRGASEAIFTRKIRFENDSSFPEWKTKKVGEICKIQTGKSNTQDETNSGLYDFYVRSPIVRKSNRYLLDCEAVLTVGDGVGTGKVFHYVTGKFDLHQRVYAMTNFSEVSGKYFYYYFSQFFYDRVMKMTAKTSVDSVRYEMIDKMDIIFPSIEEQQLIVNFLSNIENRLLYAEKILAKLENTKKGLLQQLFI